MNISLAHNKLMRLLIVTVSLLLALFAGQSNAQEPKISYLYDDLGRLVRVIDENGDAATYHYDAVGNILSITRETGVPLTTVVTSVSPPAESLGKTFSMTITGFNFAGGSLSTTTPGVTLSNPQFTPDQITVNVTISTTAQVGDAPMQLDAGLGLVTVPFTVLPDPGTTVVGTIVDRDGNPVAGATVTCLGVSGSTGADGTFSISNVPTIQGDIRCTVVFITADGRTLAGSLAGVSPLPGGTVDGGEIVVVERGIPTLQIASITPPPGTPSWVLDLPIAVRFSDPLDPATVTEGNFFVTDGAGELVGGTLTLSTDSTIVTFTPTGNLAPQTSYAVTITPAVRSLQANSLTEQFVTSFTTAQTVIFVDASLGNDTTGDGSEASPFATVGRGIQAAGAGDAVKVVGGTYVENVILKSGVTLQGAGADLTILDGSSAATPIPVITAEPNTAILGVAVQNGNGDGILGQDVPFIVGDSKVSHAANNGISLSRPFDSLAVGDVVISRSSILDSGANGIVTDGDFLGNIMLMGNTVSGYLGGQAGVFICCSISGNFIVVVNLIDENEGVGLDFCCTVTGITTITRNEMQNNDDAMSLCCTFETGLVINDNLISNNRGNSVEVCCDVIGEFIVQRNQLQGNIFGGMFLCCTFDGDVDISDNLVEGIDSEGIDLCCDVLGNFTAHKNHIRNHEFTGMNFCCTFVGTTIVSVNEVASNGFGVQLCCEFEGQLTFDDNIVNSNNNIGLDLCCTSSGSIAVVGNSITDNGDSGIDLFQLSPLIQNNLIVRNDRGLQILQGSTPILRNNTIQDNANDGVLIGDFSQPDMGATLDPGSNIITGNGVSDPSIFFDIRNESPRIISAEGNTFDHQTAAEIDALDIFDDEEGRAQRLISGAVNFNNFLDSNGSIVTVADTTVQGSVVDLDGLPLVGATVAVIGGPTGLTDGTGMFSITGAPTIVGPLRSTATAITGGGTLFGISVAVPPVIGGVTDLGQTVVAPEVAFSGSDFFLPATEGLAGDIVSGDWVKDGDIDLAAVKAKNTSGPSGTIREVSTSILLGDGLGGFSVNVGPFVGTGTSPLSIAKGDFNGDGFLDLVTTHQENQSGQVSLLVADQSGGFVLSETFIAGNIAKEAVTGDFNGDGNLDIVTTDPQDLSLRVNSTTGAILTPPGEVSILLGDGFGSFSPAAKFPSGGFVPNDLVTGDFNGDGNLDLAVVHPVFRPDLGIFSNASVLFGDGTGSFGSPLTILTGVQTSSIIATDLNGDGTMDLATANTNGSSVSVLLGDGLGNFTATHFSAGIGPGSRGPTTIVDGDFNGDGVVDLAVGGTFETAILLGDGVGGFFDAVILSEGSRGRIVRDDFSGDGSPDLALSVSTKVRVLLNTTDP